MEEKNKKEYIDLLLVIHRILENKRKFFIVLPITFVLACAYVLCLPRYYSTEVKLVPEIGGDKSFGGAIGSLASSFGIDLGSMESSDAISPLLYPDLMDDNAFVASLFDIHVVSKPGSDWPVDTTYYAYMRHFQQKTPWAPMITFFKELFSKKEDSVAGGGGKYDPYNISRKDFALMEKIRDNISFSIDKKTAVITLTVKTQDPYICRQMADSVKDRLQSFITEYRTKKARVDCEYYKELAENAKDEYMNVVAEYSDFVDANRGIFMQSVKSKQEDLENEVQMKLAAYQNFSAQYQAAQAKIQERTPVFTTLKGASVPVKPAGPKRMLIVALMLFLAFSVLVFYFLKDDIKKQLS